ncbi:hypothetical protein NE237_021091 [Protea cynaroides]|uniref:Uncharacterized protein n=1 Tax=Protea cynaroides TaxID=273540 RepID=A0A9Q0H9N3_9MAGN|nr:hypothetical protein NE237_021091 [Protea cynaroides]
MCKRIMKILLELLLEHSPTSLTSLVSFYRGNSFFAPGFSLINGRVVWNRHDPSPAILARHQTMMQVKQLRWKCRRNQTILVDGLPVEVFWDVHNWHFGTVLGSVVFIFQTCVADGSCGPVIVIPTLNPYPPYCLGPPHRFSEIRNG